MKIDSQDRESGAISFSKHIGKGEFILNVQIAGTKGGVNVQTTGSYGGDLAIRGLHEEVIRNFHVLLFRILRITDPASRQIKMEQLK